MKIFHCAHCDQLVFFENVACTRCGHVLAFLPDLRVVASLDSAGADTWRSPLPAASGGYRLCHNYSEHNVCNWAVPAQDANALCRSCRLTRTIPDLAAPGNKDAWFKLEIAKRRLIYSLLGLGLPVRAKTEDSERGLGFDFLADVAGQAVLTGHDNGVITINIAEADDAQRERLRNVMH